MNAETIWLLKTFFSGIAALLAVLAGLFAFLDEAYAETQEMVRRWFRAKWQAINESTWMELPERASMWLINATVGFLNFCLRILDTNLVRIVVLTGVPILLFSGTIIILGAYKAITLTVILFLVLIVVSVFAKLRPEQSKPFVRAYVAILCLMASVVWMLILLRMEIGLSALIMILLLPFYWFFIGWPVAIFFFKASKSTQDWLLLFAIGVSIGFLATFSALLIGHLTDPLAYVPQTFQMLISNVIFDGFTLVVTLLVISWALAQKVMLRIPMAIALDIVSAALLACGSLFFGLVLTQRQLSIKALLNILVARSPDGSMFELSPYFWTMHTTFIPTLLYLLFILFCWFAKAFLIPVRWFFGRGQEHKNPLKLTAALFGFMVLIFSLLAFFANSVEERMKEKGKAVLLTHDDYCWKLNDLRSIERNF